MITRRDEQKKSIREYMRGGREYVKQTALSRELPGQRAPLFRSHADSRSLHRLPCA